MKFKVRNDNVQLLTGTSLQGQMSITYDSLMAVFGDHLDGHYKSDAEWILEFEDGTVASIYNWKNGKNYLGEEGLPLREINDWHIGGKSARAAMLVAEVCKDHLIGDPYTLQPL